MTTPTRCYFCGNVEGEGGRLPIDYPPDVGETAHSDNDNEWWCAPLPESWKSCAYDGQALPLHDLVMEGGGTSSVYFLCRRHVIPSRLVQGHYKKTTCYCEVCTSKAWRAFAPTPRQRRQDARSAARSEKTTSDTIDPSAERQGRLALMIASTPMSTKEIAAAMSTPTATITQRTARRHVKAIGAVEVREGKSIKWTMPSEDIEDTEDTP